MGRHKLFSYSGKASAHSSGFACPRQASVAVSVGRAACFAGDPLFAEGELAAALAQMSVEATTEGLTKASIPLPR
eukprot:5638059-Amphidinium_carterae.1